MYLTRQDLEHLVSTHLGDEVLKSLLKNVFQVRKSAYSSCRNMLERYQAENLYGHLVRELLSCSLLDLGIGFGWETSNERARGQKWYQAELYKAPFVVSAATVDRPGGMVRDCYYRRKLVESNPTLNLGDRFISRSESDIAMILTHSRYYYDRSNPQLPGSACLVFPAADLKEYIHVIDLIERYPDTVEPFYPVEWDEEARLSYLKQTSIIGVV